MMANKNTITIDWVTVNKDWFDWLSNSANTSWRYRKFPDSDYKISTDHDTTWYTIRWGWVWPLQWKWDYFIKLADDWFRDAIDADWKITRIPNIYYYYDEKWFLKPYDNWKNIRLRALEYWNTKNKDKIKSKADINVDWANNINWEWWEGLTKKLDKLQAEYMQTHPVTSAEARKIIRPQAIAEYVYPYKDAEWNNLMKASQMPANNTAILNFIPHDQLALRRWTRTYSSKWVRKYG